VTGRGWTWLIPASASSDAHWILAGRGIRAFADGFVSILLPLYLLQLGFGALAIGSIITSTLIGSASLTLWLGAVANRFSRRGLLRSACLLMAGTGIAFAMATDYWPLLIIAFVGTVNPTAGDVSPFLPLEHTVLTESVEGRDRTALFARYSLTGTLAGALGILASSLPYTLSHGFDMNLTAGVRFMFVFYGVLAVVALFLYQQLSPAVEEPSDATAAPLGPSKRIVYRLMVLFSIDSFGSGFFVQSLLALWLFQRFGLSVSTAAAILFWSSICSAVSFLIAVPLAKRFGLINTMVLTHLPANIFLILVPFAPNLTVAVGLLLARGLLSQMDVPTRTSYVMAVVTPSERPAAASATAVPRSLAAALSPMFAGYLFSLSTFGWPLIIGGALKVVYDILLLRRFKRVVPPDET
jgi:MFS family permease